MVSSLGSGDSSAWRATTLRAVAMASSVRPMSVSARAWHDRALTTRRVKALSSARWSATTWRAIGSASAGRPQRTRASAYQRSWSASRVCGRTGPRAWRVRCRASSAVRSASAWRPKRPKVLDSRPSVRRVSSCSTPRWASATATASCSGARLGSTCCSLASANDDSCKADTSRPACAGSCARRSASSAGAMLRACSYWLAPLSASSSRARQCRVIGWRSPNCARQRGRAGSSAASPRVRSPRRLQLAPTSTPSSPATAGLAPSSTSMRVLADASRSMAVTTPPVPSRGVASVKIDAMNSLTCSARCWASSADAACACALRACHSASSVPAASASSTATWAWAPPTIASTTAAATALAARWRPTHLRRR